MAQYETSLTPEQEVAFQAWRTTLPKALQYMGDYDLKGAFLAQASPSANAHLTDQFKEPNHPTFSVESQYAPLAPAMAGSWGGPNQDQYQPSVLSQALRQIK